MAAAPSARDNTVVARAERDARKPANQDDIFEESESIARSMTHARAPVKVPASKFAHKLAANAERAARTVASTAASSWAIE